MTPNETLSELLAKWEEAWEHGTDILAADLCTGHPELREQVERRIDRLRRMAWMVRSDGDEADAHSDQPDPLLGTILAGRYRIEAFVGEGGFGRVYRATDAELHRPVAVKFARGRMPASQSNLFDEARRAAKLRHVGIVAVLDVGSEGDRAFVVTPFIAGPNLAEVIEKRRPTPREAARIVADVAEALDHAHREGFVHRDIKPANVLLDGERPLLADFGLAASFEEVARRKGVRSGTLMYMSPETVAGETQLISGKSDIYSLGVLLYELLTGQPPYQARTPGALREQVLFRPPVPPRFLNPQVPEALEAVCLRCLSKLPADRFATAAEMAVALRVAPPRCWRRLSLRWVSFALLAIILLGAGVVLGMLLSSSTKSEPTKAESPSEDGVLVFDGQSRIVTPLERFAPCTLEAWVKPKVYSVRDCQFFVGSDVPTKHGISLGMSEAVLCAEYVTGMTFTEAAVPLHRWSHVAAVFGTTETRLYLDGRKVGVGPPTKPLGGAVFVVGNVGRGNPINYFVGGMRSVRISKGERYHVDVVPDRVFTKDAEGAPFGAVLIYDGSAIEGDRVIDRSGNGNDGRWEWTKP